MTCAKTKPTTKINDQMNFFTTTHNHYYGHDGSVIKSLLREILGNQGAIMATQEELTAQLVALKAQAEKSEAEERAVIVTMTQQIADLNALIAAGGPVTPELQAAADALGVSLQSLDDLNPDAPTT